MKDIKFVRLTKVIAEHSLTVRLLFTVFVLVFLSSGAQLAAHYLNWQVETAFSAGAIVSVVFFAGYLFRAFVLPLNKVIRATDQIGHGELNHRIDVATEGELGQLAASINNMTETLEHRLTEVSLLSQISRESTLSRNLNRVLDLILEKAISIQQADSGSIMLVDQDQENLIIKTSSGLNPEIKPGTRVPIQDGIAGWVAREGRPIVLIDGMGSDHTFIQEEKVRNAVSLPILLDNRVVGILNLSYQDRVDGRHFSPTELGFLTTLTNHAAAAINNAQLFEELRTNYFSTVEALATAIDAKDPYTHGHSARVADYAIATAREMKMSESELEMMQTAAYLHDVGKIGIPEPILTKPGKLTTEEYEIIKTHPEISARILSPVNFRGEVISIVRHHHERFDGDGYPDRVKGESIPLPARILAVADAYDAMTSERPYRPSMDPENAKAELIRCAGTQFDKEIVQAFLKTIEGYDVGIAQTAVAPGLISGT